MEEKKKELMKKIKLHKYAGETSRGVFERSWEHTKSRDQLQENEVWSKSCQVHKKVVLKTDNGVSPHPRTKKPVHVKLQIRV